MEGKNGDVNRKSTRERKEGQLAKAKNAMHVIFLTK